MHHLLLAALVTIAVVLATVSVWRPGLDRAIKEHGWDRHDEL